MKQLIAFVLTACVFTSNFAVLAQRNAPGMQPRMVEQVVPVEILDPANNYNEKGLPEPVIIGSGRSDHDAAKIAKELSKYEDKSLAYLVATLQKAGFYIIDENQKILYRPTVDGNGTGLAFYDYEVVGMYKLSRGGYVTTVGKLANVISKEFPAAKRPRMGELMLEDLRKAANLPTSLASGEKSNGKAKVTKRFLARLIIELGKQFPQPVDLMTATPETAQLNIIQASMWMRRFVGDVIAYATAHSTSGFRNDRNTGDLLRPKRHELDFLNASYSNPIVPPDPCNYANEETLDVDVAATALTTVHGGVVGAFVEEEIETATTGSMGQLQKLGTGLGVANLVLSWAKLIAAASQMHGTIKVAEPMPLIRTKSNIAPGERKLLTGTFEIKINNLRQLNCFRTTMNMTTGLDFSMPSSGPLGVKPVSWELGGDVSFKGQNSSQTGVFDQVVYLLPLDDANRDQHKQETDANGVSKIFLEGAKQKNDLNGSKVVPLPKRASVRADVALKNMKDSKQEVVDISSFAIGFATGGGLLGILSALSEVGQRIKIPVVAVNVPIRDWTPCSQDWGGTISVKRELSRTIVVKSNRMSNGNGTGDGIRQISELDVADVTLNPRRPDEMREEDPRPATIVLHGNHSDIETLSTEADPCCGKTEGTFSTKFRRGKEMKYSDIVKHIVNVSYRGSERDYSLSMLVNTDPFPAQFREFSEYTESNCDAGNDAHSDETDGIWLLNLGLDDGRYGQRLINSEGELLFGEKEITGPDGAKETWSWALARCQP